MCLTTPRLSLAPYANGDVAPYSPSWVEKCLAHQVEHGFSYWPCRVRISGQVVGFCGWKVHDLGVSLGYGINPEYQGLGYATEAASAAIDWGCTNIGPNKMFVSVRPPNAASDRVLIKAGMRKCFEYEAQGRTRWLYVHPSRTEPLLVPVEGIIVSVPCRPVRHAGRCAGSRARLGVYRQGC